MSATGLEVFDTTLQKTNKWLDEIMEEMGIKTRQQAYDALRGCLHALRERLTIEEAAHLAAQMPLLIKGIFYDGWKPNTNPTLAVRDRTLDGFYNDVIKAHGGKPYTTPETMAKAVFKVMSRHITSGEIEEVKNALPEKIRALWP